MKPSHVHKDTPDTLWVEYMAYTCGVAVKGWIIAAALINRSTTAFSFFLDRY